MKINIKKWFNKFFGLDKYEFERVIIEREVIDAIMEIATHTYPKEFIAFLKGKNKDKVLRINELAYQEYVAGYTSTVFKDYLPLTSGVVGTVHSHPGFSNHPSNADLRTFSKKGIFHIIISKPYTKESMQAYDMNGRKIGFEIEEQMSPQLNGTHKPTH